MPAKLVVTKVLVGVMVTPRLPVTVWVVGLMLVTVRVMVAVALPLVPPVPVTVYVVAD